jgi:uncharacterized protein YndB with AHSA1/START domain
METTTETVSLQREITIAARPETVWEFLVDPDKAVRWMGTSASFEPHRGGLYRIDVVGGHTARGEFVELDAPRRLVFTFGWEPEPGAEGPNAVPPGSSTVEIELAPDGDGTRLRFTHRDLPNGEAVESHGHGWDHYLERLAVAAAGGDPGSDPWLTGEM